MPFAFGAGLFLSLWMVALGLGTFWFPYWRLLAVWVVAGWKGLRGGVVGRRMAVGWLFGGGLVAPMSEGVRCKTSECGVSGGGAD